MSRGPEIRDQGFLSRWSRMKQASRETEGAKQEEADTVSVVEPAPPPEAADPDSAAPGEEQRDLELPKIEELGPESDFKPFMRAGVSTDMRNQALRKLWASNPLYNHIDMLDDYCEDYTDKAMVVPGMKTAYKIGRGLLDMAAGENDVAEPRDRTLDTKPDKSIVNAAAGEVQADDRPLGESKSSNANSD